MRLAVSSRPRAGNIGYQRPATLTRVTLRTLMTPIRFKAQFSVGE
ncbi:hypothetical protein [Methylobacterium sp. Leaf99]|nr:hypothetical protein [Methylobacterium sp. Leaf99]